MKLKIRNGYGFDFEKTFRNDNFICLRLNTLDWGLGFNFNVGDSRRFFNSKYNLFTF